LPLIAISVAAFLLVCAAAVAQEATELPKVTVANPQTMPISDSITFTGTVTATQTVNLVARVEGYLEELLFEDGSFVEEGQALFTIEPDQYEEDLRQNLASLRYAEEEYARQQAMLQDNATSLSSVQQAQSNRDQALAQVRLAEINLGYTIVAAPFSGRIGLHQVDPGNLVGAGGNPTTIVTVDRLVPIYVDFNLNERDALTIREMRRKAGEAVLPNDIGFVPVFGGLSEETGYPHEGRLDFIDSSVDTSTGTIEMRAIFANADFTMFPGLLARVRIPLGTPKPTLVVPNAAVSADQIGSFVLVVDKDDIVQRVSVVTGPLDGDMRAIESGLTAQDRVVVNGLVYAKPGAKVDPMDQQTSQSASESQ
jgi:RND family efflux transporter MFP subunit